MLYKFYIYIAIGFYIWILLNDYLGTLKYNS